MSFARRSSRRLSGNLQRIIQPLLEGRKSASRKSSEARSGDKQAEIHGHRTTSAESDPCAESTPPTSIWATDTLENVCEEEFVQVCRDSESEPEKACKEITGDEEPTPLTDKTHSSNLGGGSYQLTKVTKESADRGQRPVQRGAVLESRELPLGGNAEFSLTCPRKGPLSTPPISPRSTSPAVAERGRLSLSGAVRDSKLMAEQVQVIRKAFKVGIQRYFRFFFADAKLLLKALDMLADSLNSLRLQLDVVSRPMLDEIELVDMHFGALLQEGDRIIRAMTRAGSTSVPLTGKSKSLRKSMIRDMAPQMVGLAETIKILKDRIDRVTQTIIVERAGARARRDLLARAFGGRTLNSHLSRN